MLRIVALVFLLLNSALLQATTLQANAAKSNTILIVGDSISAAYGIDPQAAWGNLLAIKVTQEKKPYQVINASISGDTTINGLKRLQPLLNKYQPQILILELGGNDGLRGLSIESMKKNLQQMIELALLHKSDVLLAGMKIPPNYGKRYTDAFTQVYSDLSAQYQLPLIPFLLEGIGDKAELMQNDGIHPNQAAQPLILQTVWDHLELML